MLIPMKWSTVVRFHSWIVRKKKKEDPNFLPDVPRNGHKHVCLSFPPSPSVRVHSLLHMIQTPLTLLSLVGTALLERCTAGVEVHVPVCWFRDSMTLQQSPIQRGIPGSPPLQHLWPALLYSLVERVIKAFELFEFSSYRTTFLLLFFFSFFFTKLFISDVI